MISVIHWKTTCLIFSENNKEIGIHNRKIKETFVFTLPEDKNIRNIFKINNNEFIITSSKGRNILLCSTL